jgi:hypothetical protein
MSHFEKYVQMSNIRIQELLPGAQIEKVKALVRFELLK